MMTHTEARKIDREEKTANKLGEAGGWREKGREKEGEREKTGA